MKTSLFIAVAAFSLLEATGFCVERGPASSYGDQGGPASPQIKRCGDDFVADGFVSRDDRDLQAMQLALRIDDVSTYAVAMDIALTVLAQPTKPEYLRRMAVDQMRTIVVAILSRGASRNAAVRADVAVVSEVIDVVGLMRGLSQAWLREPDDLQRLRILHVFGVLFDLKEGRLSDDEVSLLKDSLVGILRAASTTVEERTLIVYILTLHEAAFWESERAASRTLLDHEFERARDYAEIRIFAWFRLLRFQREELGSVEYRAAPRPWVRDPWAEDRLHLENIVDMMRSLSF